MSWWRGRFSEGVLAEARLLAPIVTGIRIRPACRIAHRRSLLPMGLSAMMTITGMCTTLIVIIKRIPVLIAAVRPMIAAAAMIAGAAVLIPAAAADAIVGGAVAAAVIEL